jgi:hypothetical protein
MSVEQKNEGKMLDQMVTVKWQTKIENKSATVTIQLAALLQELGVQITEDEIQKAAQSIYLKR